MWVVVCEWKIEERGEREREAEREREIEGGRERVREKERNIHPCNLRIHFEQTWKYRILQIIIIIIIIIAGVQLFPWTTFKQFTVEQTIAKTCTWFSNNSLYLLFKKKVDPLFFVFLMVCNVFNDVPVKLFKWHWNFNWEREKEMDRQRDRDSVLIS